MGADARAGLGAPGDDDVLQGVIRRSRHPRQARRPEPVVQILVNLVTHDTVSQRRDLARLQSGDRGVAPEPQARELRRHLHADAAVDVRPVRHVQSAGQRVLRAARVGRRHEAVVAPRARPDGRGVDFRVGLALLVANECPIWGARGVGAVLPAGLPEHLVAAEERQVHAGVARRFDVHPHPRGPVFVVADRKERLVLQDLGPEALGVDAGKVADVVPASLEEAHRRVLVVEW